MGKGLLTDNRIHYIDGGMGSLLVARGLGTGEVPDTWNLSRPEDIIEVHTEYLNAGADYLTTNTFSSCRLKFPDNLREIITAGVNNAKEAVRRSGRDARVMFDIGPTGKLLKPLGTLDFEEAVDIFGEAARIAEEAGADLCIIETMSDSYEMKAAVLGVKENTNLPIFATAVFDENLKMMTGCTPKGLVALLEGLGVDALGINCSLGPEQMLPVFKELCEYASIPLIISPNAGLPKSDNGVTYYDLSADGFSDTMVKFAEMGAHYLGGCCGTTPEFIEKTKKKTEHMPRIPLTDKGLTLVSSGMQCVEIGRKSVIIGERINPTGKSKFKQALRDNNINYILGEADAQIANGAHILDVNVGLPEIDEVEMMGRVVYEIQSIFPVPLQIDTTSKEAMEKALRIYNGKPMINSVNGKEEIMAEIYPLVKKYGGVVVGLALDEDGIPETAEGRLKIAEKIYSTGESYGIARKDIVIDALTMTMSTNDESANITLDTVKEITRRGGHTVLGVSNISFGLPQRELITAAFYTQALFAGLSAGIINPNAKLMKQAYDTYLVLGGFDKQCLNYIEGYTQTPEDKERAKLAEDVAAGRVAVSVTDGSGVSVSGAAGSGSGVGSTTSGAGAAGASGPGSSPLQQSIIKGLKDNAGEQTRELLKTMEPLDIINNELVAALDIVGERFANGTLFLPQLLMSAEAAKAGFAAISEYMSAKGGAQKKKYPIVLATVKGDIHDIGKNIVKVLLENYDYEVIDLGKDVPPEVVTEAVIKHHAPLCGLSALMTTTVVNMEETIKMLREKAPWCKVMVGGAVLTQEYADMIGADFYGKDAMQSVRYAESLL